MSEAPEYAKGLEGIIANESALSQVLGLDGILRYRGYHIDDLVENCSFEEVVHLLNDKFPQLSLQRLEDWLTVVIQDEELAARIAETRQSDGSDHDRLLQARMLMSERLCQCKNTAPHG